MNKRSTVGLKKMDRDGDSSADDKILLSVGTRRSELLAGEYKHDKCLQNVSRARKRRRKKSSLPVKKITGSVCFAVYLLV